MGSIHSKDGNEPFSDCMGEALSSVEVSTFFVIESSLNCVGEDSLSVVVSLGLLSECSVVISVSLKVTVFIMFCLSTSIASSGIIDSSSDCVGEEGSYLSSGGI